MTNINTHYKKGNLILKKSPITNCDIKSNTFLNSEYNPASTGNFIKDTALSEIQPATYRDRVAALGVTMAFLSTILQENKGSLIWCQLRDHDRLHLHAPGLAAFGIDPARLIKITLTTEKDLLWAMEEALVSKAIAAVAGVLWSEKFYDFTASKRLRVRATEAGIPGLLVRSHRANGTTASDIRFSVASTTSQKQQVNVGSFARLGRPEWQLNLTKSRGLKPRSDHVRWHHETLRLDMATPLGNRTSQSSDRPVIPLQQTG